MCWEYQTFIEFQFKFLHRRVPTNAFLSRIGIQENENCSFCNSSSETLIHLFWSCTKTTSFWKEVIKWLQEANLLSRNYPLTNTIALGLEPNKSNFSIQINYCFLLARYHIWLSKTKPTNYPFFKSYLRLLKSRCEIESKAGEAKKWEPLAKYIND